MTSSSSLSASARPVSPAQTVWTADLAGAVRGLALARETGWVLARDDHSWLYLFDHQGRRQAQSHAPGETSASACSDDGTALAAGSKGGEVWWLAPDLMPRWRHDLGQPALALAIDPLGQYLAVSDAGGGRRLLTRRGRLIWRVQTSRPLRYLAFVPEAPFLVGSADFGLVICLDARGEVVWRDGLVAHVGSLAVSGDGGRIILACFTDGLTRYGVHSPRATPLPLPDVCRLAGASYDGEVLLTTGLINQVTVRDRAGRSRGEHELEGPAMSMALGPLADRALLGTAAGRVVALRWR